MYFSKKLICILFFLIATCANNSFAQQLGSITGTVVEKNNPIEFATIHVYRISDTIASFKNALSDSTGKFSVRQLPLGNYLLSIEIVGYKTAKQNFSITATMYDVVFNAINMLPTNTSLNNVTIVSTKKVLQKTITGFIINANANLTQIGGTATDILRNTPTVTVDEEGVITIRGKQPLILINGRNSTISNTNQIPASSIESIEVVNNPSAQYDANSEGGIINIKLKKNKQKGLTGAAAIGVGVGAKGRINSSFLLSAKWAKWNISLGYDNRFANRIRNINADRISFDIPNQYFLTQLRNDNRTDKLQTLRLNIDYTINNKNNIELELIGEKIGQDNDEDLFNTVNSFNKIFYSKNNRRSIEIEKEKVAEIALNYARKFTNKRIELTANISTSLNYFKQNTDISTQAFSADNNMLNNKQLQQTANYENGQVTNIKIDFTHPLLNKLSFDVGYKAILRYLDADFKSLNEQGGVYIANPIASSTYTFSENIHAGYVQLNGFTGDEATPTWKYNIGLRAENISNSGKTVQANNSFANKYVALFPSANIIWYNKHQAFWKLGYSRKINRPGFGQLNPFIDVTDSLNQHGGNPNLQPEFINSIELGYNKDWDKISLYSILYYRNATNSIRQFSTLQPNGVALALPQNFGEVETYGIENIITAKPLTFYDINFSVSLYQLNIKGVAVGQDIANDVLSWNTKLINNFSIGKRGKLQITGVYNSPIALPQGKKIEMYNVDLGYQQKIGKSNSRIGLVITDVFNTLSYGNLLSANNFSYNRIGKVDSRAILVTYAYTFGTSFKEKLLDNKFSND